METTSNEVEKKYKGITTTLIKFSKIVLNYLIISQNDTRRFPIIEDTLLETLPNGYGIKLRNKILTNIKP